MNPGDIVIHRLTERRTRKKDGQTYYSVHERPCKLIEFIGSVAIVEAQTPLGLKRFRVQREKIYKQGGTQ
jgi:hypothetical protein